MLGGDGLAYGGLALDRGVEVALRAVVLPTACRADPPGADLRWKVDRPVAVTQLGDDRPPISGLDLEPHAVAQRHDTFGGARIAPLRDQLGGSHDRVVDLVERQAQVGRSEVEINQAASSGPDTGCGSGHGDHHRRTDRHR
ncbi:MAG: hypothetical protein FWE61_03265 [Micrococcales bacterium]|nr:hypothetical protein [Micrococcales bacterium]